MSEHNKNNKKNRREFIHQASGAMGIVAVGAAGWPLIDQMNPSKDVEALAKIEIERTTTLDGKDIGELPTYNLELGGRKIFLLSTLESDNHANHFIDNILCKKNNYEYYTLLQNNYQSLHVR